VIEHRVAWLDPIFVGLSIVGSWAAVWLAIALAVAFVWRRPNVFLVVATTALATNLVTAVIKEAVGRERPPAIVLDPEPLMEVPTTSSFPSGHASISFACAYVLSRLAPRLTPFVYVLAALIAFSRIYVGVHFPLDVLAGALLGTVVAIALLRLLGALRRSPPAPPAG
jgi:undecaprenyl-diphosphatase